MDRMQFRISVKEILNHISDIAYLENHNLMNLLLTPDEAHQTNRIRLLRNKISEAIDTLRPPDDTPVHATEWRCHRILTLRYLNLMEFHQIEYDLGLSQRQVQRDLKKALDALISILWNQAHAGEANPGEEEVVDSGISDATDLEAVKEELKNWEMTLDLYNLSQIVEQAIQLCASPLNPDLPGRVDDSAVNSDLNVMVDQILTKQGIYKCLTMLASEDPDGAIVLQTRKISSYFVELSFRFRSELPLNLHNWEIAQLMFTIQGVNHSLNEDGDETAAAIVLPLTQQNSCLVIDDVSSVRRLVERMLGSYGVQVFGAGNQQEALNLAQLMQPNFILLDVLMPKMDGWQMIKQLKANPETSDIPVIICSVLVEPELAKQAGAAGFVRKPINRIELVRTLQDKGFIKSGLADTSGEG